MPIAIHSQPYIFNTEQQLLCSTELEECTQPENAQIFRS